MSAISSHVDPMGFCLLNYKVNFGTMKPILPKYTKVTKTEKETFKISTDDAENTQIKASTNELQFCKPDTEIAIASENIAGNDAGQDVEVVYGTAIETELSELPVSTSVKEDSKSDDTTVIKTKIVDNNSDKKTESNSITVSINNTDTANSLPSGTTDKKTAAKKIAEKAAAVKAAKSAKNNTKKTTK